MPSRVGPSRHGQRSLAGLKIPQSDTESGRGNSDENLQFVPLPTRSRRVESLLRRLTRFSEAVIFRVPPKGPFFARRLAHRGEWLEAGKAADSRRD
jgi:hypothetical protein